MSERIRGLKCVRCQGPIESAGLSCSACGAPHHAACFDATGRCMSCECAKPPCPFSVAPPAGGRPFTIGAVVLLVVLVVPFAMQVQMQNRMAQVRQERAAVAGQSTPWQTKETVSRFSRPDEAWQARQAARKAMIGLDSRASSKGNRPRRSIVQLTQRPGRAQGSVSETIYPAGVQDSLEIVLDRDRYGDLLLSIDGKRGNAGPRAPFTKLKVEVALSDQPAESTVQADRWTDLSPITLCVTRQRWHRVSSPRPFNRARLSLIGAKTEEAFVSTLVAVKAARPEGVALDCARFLTITRLAGTVATLATETGEELKVPVSVLMETPSPDAVMITGSDCGGILSVGRDGSISMFGLQGGSSWGSDVGSLAGQHGSSSAGRVGGPGMGAWVDETGAWLALTRWPQAALKDHVYDPAIETGFSLLSDDRVEISWPRGGMSHEMFMIGDLRDLIASAAQAEEPVGFFQRPRSYDERRRILNARRDCFAQGGRAEKEFIRFVSAEVLPRFSKLAKERTAFQVGDRMMLTWRRYSTSRTQKKNLTVAMLGASSVLVRNDALVSVADSEEMDLPVAFLPPAPAPHVGQDLVFYRADDLALASRVNPPKTAAAPAATKAPASSPSAKR